MIDKSPEAFRTISEVSEDLDLPQHVLRFWESKFSSIKPLKRGGGRRYYRPSDVDLLRGIRHLLYSEGFTIKGVQKILREQGVRQVSTCWQDDPDLGIDVSAGFSESERGDVPVKPAAAARGGERASGSGNISAQQVKGLKSVLKVLRDARSRLEAARHAK